MTPTPIEQLIEMRLEQAHESLREANTLREAGLLRGTINRAYYAMFYAVLSLTALRQEITSKHSGVVAFFDRNFIKTGIFPREPHAAAEGHVENRVVARPGAAQRFAQRRHVGIVVHRHRRPRELPQPAAQVKLRPALDLVRAADAAGLPIHRPAKTNAHLANPLPAQQLRQRLLNLLPDARRPPRPVNRQLPPRVNPPRRISPHELQLGAANFNPEKHAGRMPKAEEQRQKEKAPRRKRGGGQPAASALPLSTLRAEDSPARPQSRRRKPGAFSHFEENAIFVDRRLRPDTLFPVAGDKPLPG